MVTLTTTPKALYILVRDAMFLNSKLVNPEPGFADSEKEGFNDERSDLPFRARMR